MNEIKTINDSVNDLINGGDYTRELLKVVREKMWNTEYISVSTLINPN